MRVPIAAMLIALCGAGVTMARAADLPVGGSAPYYSEGGFGQRSASLMVYDYQPGIVVRAYWSAPWRHHHYFPATGHRPKFGRVEDMSAPSEPSEPAATFKRSWSNASAFLAERPRLTARDRLPAPQAEPPLPPLK
jgi:hypothetical protein